MAETWNNIRYVLDRFLKVDIWAYAVVIWTFGNETFGPNFWGVVILAQLMIVFDTELKWVYLSKKYIYDTYQPEDPLENISLRKAICYFFKSETWQKGYLESRGFSRIIEKMLLYNATIIVAFYAAKVIPPIHALGINLVASDILPGSVSIVIFMVETTSINENLVELGYSSIANAVKRVLDYMLDRVFPKRGN